jgi:hypothetical protein
MATLEDLEKRVGMMGGLYPYDLYSLSQGTDPMSQAVRGLSGGVNIPEVNLQGAPTLTPGQVTGVSGVTGGSLPKGSLTTGTSTGTMGNRLDELVNDSSPVTAEGIGTMADLLSSVDPDKLDMGNINTVADMLVSQQYPNLGTEQKGKVINLIADLYAAGQDPQFQQSYFETKKGAMALNKQKRIQYQQAKAASKNQIYGKLLDYVLREDKDSPVGTKIVNVFRPDVLESGGSVDDATQNARIRTTAEGDEVLEIVAGVDENGNNIYQTAPAETVVINNPGQLQTLRESARGQIDNKEYTKASGVNSAKNAAAQNIVAPVNQMLEIASSPQTPRDIAGFTGALFDTVGRIKTELDTLQNNVLGKLDKDQQAIANRVSGYFDNLTQDNNTTSANGLENAVDENGKALNFKWSELGTQVANNAVYKALFLELAYYSLLLKGQESRAVSDKDIVNALRTIGGDASTPEAAMRTIVNFTSKALSAAENEAIASRRAFKTKAYQPFRDYYEYTLEDIDKEFQGPITALLDPTNQYDSAEFNRFLNFAQIYGGDIGNQIGPYNRYLVPYIGGALQQQQSQTDKNLPKEELTNEDIALNALKAAGIKIGSQ